MDKFISLFDKHYNTLVQPKLIKQVVLKDVINSSGDYITLKNVMLAVLDISPDQQAKISADFIQLEQAGLSSFTNIPERARQLLDTDLQYMTTDQYMVKYIDTGIKSPIFVSGSKFGLHTGVIDLISLLNSSKFMAADIFDGIHSDYTDMTIYTTGTCIRYLFVLSTKSGKTIVDESKLIFLCQIAQMAINIIDTIDDRITTKFDLMLFLSNTKKTFPKKKKTCLTSQHANSGDTHSFPVPLIRIYRLEEHLKVLLHEIVHATGLDSLFADSPKDVLFNEVIAETFAELVNCLLYSRIHHVDFIPVFEKEVNHGFQQTVRIMSHFDCDIVDLKKTMCQKTAVYEYHVLKTAMLNNIEKFVDNMFTIKNAGDLYKIIKKYMESKDYQDVVNQDINTSRDIGFRMTVTEIQYGGNQIDYRKKYYKYKKKYLTVKNFI